MTLSTDLFSPTAAPAQVIRNKYATEMAVERTRLLYQGSLLPTLFMLINGLVCAALLWSPQRYLLDSIWLVWLLALVAFLAPADAAHAAADPLWQRLGVAALALGALVGAGLWLLNPLFRILAKAGAREVMTAAALLVVLGAALLMELGGLSMAMGAFVAGVLLSESMRYVSAGWWWLGVLPGLCLLAMVLTFEQVALGLRLMLDPRRAQE